MEATAFMVSLSLSAELCHYYLGRAGAARGWAAPSFNDGIFPGGFVILSEHTEFIG